MTRTQSKWSPLGKAQWVAGLCAVWGRRSPCGSRVQTSQREQTSRRARSAPTRRRGVRGLAAIGKSAKLPPRDDWPEQLLTRNANKPLSLGEEHTPLWTTHGAFLLYSAPESGASCSGNGFCFPGFMSKIVFPQTEPTINTCYQEGLRYLSRQVYAPGVNTHSVHTHGLWYMFYCAQSLSEFVFNYLQKWNLKE